MLIKKAQVVSPDSFCQMQETPNNSNSVYFFKYKKKYFMILLYVFGIPLIDKQDKIVDKQ